MRRAFKFIALVLLVLCSVPAAAQEATGSSDGEPKLQVVIIDSDPRDKGRAFKPLAKALDEREDVRVTSEADFLESAKSRDVTLETLRKGSEREKAEEQIAAAMQDAGIEVVIVVDAIRKRRYAQAVVLGPKGRELADIRERLKRLESSSNVDKYVLNEAFQVASTEVEEHRAMLAKRAEEERLAEEAKRAEAQGVAEAQAANEVSAEAEVESSSDARGAGFVIDAGVLVGQRVFDASASESSYAVDSTTPLTGATAAAEVRLATFGSGAVVLGLSGAYAPLSMEFVADGGEPFQVSGHHVTGRFELGYRHWFGGTYAGLKLGADAVSSTLDPNSYFTGSRYIAGLGALEIGYLSLGGIGFGVSGGVLPVLDSNISGDAYGEPASSTGLAYHADATLQYAITQGVALKVGYGARRYAAQYDEPSVSTSPVSTTDLIHGGNVSVAFRF